jgi:hypothetical protein
MGPQFPPWIDKIRSLFMLRAGNRVNEAALQPRYPSRNTQREKVSPTCPPKPSAKAECDG